MSARTLLPEAGSFGFDPENILRCFAFDRFVWQNHGFGTRQKNPEAAVTLRQIHSDIVRNANSLSGRQCEGDALVTNRIGTAIGVRTADCVPLLLLDPRTLAVAACHAGWRGTASAIVRRAVEQLQTHFGANPANLYVAIGPAIRACCYVVGPEVANRFTPLFPEWVTPPEAPLRLDLPEANRRQLIAAGVPQQQIFDCSLCTACDAVHFFSFRREPGNPGRMLSAISRIA